MKNSKAEVWKTAQPPERAARPKCHGCDKPLVPMILVHTAPVAGSSEWETISRAWHGRYRGYPRGVAVPRFCTLRCALDFADAVVALSRSRLEAIEQDSRFKALKKSGPALVDVNAPLALIQVEMKAQHYAFSSVLRGGRGK